MADQHIESKICGALFASMTIPGLLEASPEGVAAYINEPLPEVLSALRDLQSRTKVRLLEDPDGGTKTVVAAALVEPSSEYVQESFLAVMKSRNSN